jgi:hypothetical protein
VSSEKISIVEPIATDQVGQHHVFGAEAVGESGRREIAAIAQQRVRLFDLGGDGVEQRRSSRLIAQMLMPPQAAARRNSGCGWSTAAW